MAGELRDSAKEVKPTHMPPSSIPRPAWANIGATPQIANSAPDGSGFAGPATRVSPSRETDLSDPAGPVSAVAMVGSRDSGLPSNNLENAGSNTLILGFDALGVARTVGSEPLAGMNSGADHSMRTCQEAKGILKVPKTHDAQQIQTSHEMNESEKPREMNDAWETHELQVEREAHTAYEAQKIHNGDADEDSLDVDHEKALLLSAICGLREAAEQALRRAETAEVALAAQGVEVPMGIDTAAAVVVQ